MNESPGLDEGKRLSTVSSKHPLRYKILAALLPLLFFLVIDLMLHLLGWMPPEDPTLSHAKTYVERFSPFVESQDGFLTIKSEWISQNEMYRGKRGELAGRLFLYPGFHPCRFARVKPPRTIRIFVFGGSTTFGLFVGKEASFSGVIEKRIGSLLPDHEVEVINLGCPGFDTTRICILMDTVMDLDPDLLIVYSGHNEMLKGHIGHHGATSPSEMHKRLLSFSAIYGWMHYWLSNVDRFQAYESAHEEVSPLPEGSIPVYDPLEVPKDERALPDQGVVRKALSDYGTNIEAMASKAAQESVPLLFVLPVSNLFLPPYISAHEKGFSQQGEFDALLETAWNALRDEDPEGALSHVHRAIALSPSYAMAWYLGGIARLSLGQEGEGFSELQRACDLDVRTHRITSPLQSAMIKAVKDTEATWIDMRPEFYKKLTPDFSKTVFLDHCHPTKHGHKLIADKIMPHVTELLGREEPETITMGDKTKQGL
jgi:lysophospholipase L1-like esterase